MAKTQAIKQNTTYKSEGKFALIAAVIVLLSAMWDPTVSVTISIIALVAFAIWEFSKN